MRLKQDGMGCDDMVKKKKKNSYLTSGCNFKYFLVRSGFLLSTFSTDIQPVLLFSNSTSK